MIKTLGIAAISAMLLAGPALAAEKLTVETSDGCAFDIKLRADLAPKHVAQFSKLAAAGFYDGILFHRVIDGFMAQTGDPTATGSGGSSEPDLPAEFSTAHYARGIVERPAPRIRTRPTASSSSCSPKMAISMEITRSGARSMKPAWPASTRLNAANRRQTPTRW